MDRKAFLKKLAGAGIVLGAAPLLGWSVDREFRPLALPAPFTHVRHGLLERHGRSRIAGLDDLQVYRHDIFFANGFAPGTDDLHQFTFSTRKGTACLSLDRKRILLDKGEDRLEIFPEKFQAVNLGNGLVLELVPGGGSQEWTPAGSGMVWPVRGMGTLNGHPANAQAALWLNQSEPLRCQLSENGLWARLGPAL